MYLDGTSDTESLHVDVEGSNRRDFVKVALMAGAAVGLPAALSAQIAEAAVKGVKPSVIWLHFQECTGCTESLLRTSHPDVAELILDLISLDYHETLFAAAGHQAEAALQKTMKDHEGKYVLVVEGAIPTKENGIYCQVGGRTAVDILNDVAGKAGAIIAIGSCASWGGIPSAEPNPTGATGAPTILKGKTVVTIPGCPANPYNLLGTVLQFATLGTLPALDEKGRPKFAYGKTIHEHCPRRAHFDAGRFVQKFGDEGHRQGWCLYKTGCKGPATHANCSVLPFGEVPDSWPHGAGGRVPRAAPHDGRHRAADAARHVCPAPRADGQGCPDCDGRRRPRPRRAPRRGLGGVEEARDGGRKAFEGTPEGGLR